ncbi:hypothetical protein ABES25_06050 [Bacillus gobiensis]|uniref:hypothetical protein n=1 Tax=Bacillus gobiensis TaxID=1441095 RepID=UPI003D26365B
MRLVTEVVELTYWHNEEKSLCSVFTIVFKNKLVPNEEEIKQEIGKNGGEVGKYGVMPVSKEEYLELVEILKNNGAFEDRNPSEYASVIGQKLHFTWIPQEDIETYREESTLLVVVE